MSKIKLYNYKTCSTAVKNQINNINDALKSILADDLTGVYLHGSMVLDSFHEKTSDLDILGVVDKPLSMQKRLEIASALISLNRKPCPIEISLIAKEHLMPWQYPTPCQFHLSEYWIPQYQQFASEKDHTHWLLTDNFTDSDIACHAKLTRQSGICLYGTEINELFPEVPENQFWESISYDVSNFDVVSDNKVYAILSLCRVWSYYKTGKIMSKYEAAILGLNILPSAFHSLLMNALHDKYGFYEKAFCTNEDALCFKSYIIEEINNIEDEFRIMTIMKTDLLDKYNGIADHKSNVTFIEINTDEMYDENSDADIPFKYIQFKDGSVVFAVITEFMDFAQNYFKVFSDKLFDKSTFEILFEFISEQMKKYHKRPYMNNNELEKHMVYYVLSDKNNIPYNKIQSTTIQFNSDTSYKNITDSYIELSINSIYYGTLINGNIVSIVGTNTPILHAPSGKVIDIGLETHPDYRQKGFALSNVIAMSDYLLNKGYFVKYRCNNKNTNSNKTALSCGFKEIAREKTIWCIGE